MTRDAVRAREKRARLKREATDIEEHLEISGIEENMPAIEVAEPAQKPKPSLKERLMGTVRQPPADKRKRTKKIDSNLLQQLAPTLIATFVATYSRQMLPELYKPCAPSQEEVLAMVAPYFNILSRYIEITGQASQNTLDLINAVLASIMYGVRAYVTYIQIKEAEKHHESLSEYHARSNREYYEKLAREEQEYKSSLEDTAAPDRHSGYLESQAAIAIHDIVSDQDGAGEHGGREAAKVDALLARELAGRRQLGLV